MPIFIAF